MKVRMNRRLLAESMETVADIEPTHEALAEHITKAWDGWPNSNVYPSMVKVEKYGQEIDHRIGWDTHIVVVEGQGVFGFTDGPLV